jgi:hypothetical protein
MASVDTVRRRPGALALLLLLFAGVPLLLEGWLRHLLLLSGNLAVGWISFGLTSLLPFTGQVLLIPAVASLSSPRARRSVLRSLGVLVRSGWGLLSFWAVNAAPALLRIAELARSATDLASPVWSMIALFEFCLSVFLALTVAVYAPVVVIEGSGITRSLRRTLQLMRVGRWQILMLFLLIGVTEGGVTLLANVALSALRLDDAASNVRLAIDSLGQLAWSLIIAASYREMVRARDGPPVDQVAEVFA